MCAIVAIFQNSAPLALTYLLYVNFRNRQTSPLTLTVLHMQTTICFWVSFSHVQSSPQPGDGNQGKEVQHQRDFWKAESEAFSSCEEALSKHYAGNGQPCPWAGGKGWRVGWAHRTHSRAPGKVWGLVEVTDFQELKRERTLVLFAQKTAKALAFQRILIWRWFPCKPNMNMHPALQNDKRIPLLHWGVCQRQNLLWLTAITFTNTHANLAWSRYVRQHFTSLSVFTMWGISGCCHAGTCMK